MQRVDLSKASENKEPDTYKVHFRKFSKVYFLSNEAQKFVVNTVEQIRWAFGYNLAIIFCICLLTHCGYPLELRQFQ